MPDRDALLALGGMVLFGGLAIALAIRMVRESQRRRRPVYISGVPPNHRSVGEWGVLSDDPNGQLVVGYPTRPIQEDIAELATDIGQRTLLEQEIEELRARLALHEEAERLSAEIRQTLEGRVWRSVDDALRDAPPSPQARDPGPKD